MSYVIKCDRCSKMGSEGDSDHLPERWRAIYITVTVPGGTRHKRHQFCPECAEYLGIGYQPPDEETSAEKLVAILEAVIDEAVSERLDEAVDA